MQRVVDVAPIVENSNEITVYVLNLIVRIYVYKKLSQKLKGEKNATWVTFDYACNVAMFCQYCALSESRSTRKPW